MCVCGHEKSPPYTCSNADQILQAFILSLTSLNTSVSLKIPTIRSPDVTSSDWMMSHDHLVDRLIQRGVLIDDLTFQRSRDDASQLDLGRPFGRGRPAAPSTARTCPSWIS